MTEKFLIIHADDFGMSPGISRGILHTIRAGIVSSTSVMVQNAARSDTRRLIKENPDIDWGLHVTIREGNGYTPDRIAAETLSQLHTFRESFGIFPSHIDYHKGFRFTNRVYFAVRMIALRYKLAFRYDNLHRVDIRFYGQKNRRPATSDISVDALIKCIKETPPGVTEIVCHPGWAGNRLKDPYRTERRQEADTLTDPVVSHALHTSHIRLIDYRTYYRMIRREQTFWT